jgi:hypothetical protein
VTKDRLWSETQSNSWWSTSHLYCDQAVENGQSQTYSAFDLLRNGHKQKAYHLYCTDGQFAEYLQETDNRESRSLVTSIDDVITYVLFE